MKNRKYKLKQGQFVVLRFIDHCFAMDGMSPPIPIRLPGWVIEETEDHIKVQTWAVDGGCGHDTGDSYSIIKHPSLRVFRFKQLDLKAA